MRNTPDVIVVGAGAAGASVAYELIKRGVSVTMIERDSVASHASGFAYGGSTRSWRLDWMKENAI